MKNILCLLFEKVQVFIFLYLLELCSALLHIIVILLYYLFLAFLLWFISFSNSMSISCNCFLFKHYVCFCREQAFILLFTRVELTRVSCLSCLLKSYKLQEDLILGHRVLHSLNGTKSAVKHSISFLINHITHCTET